MWDDTIAAVVAENLSQARDAGKKRLFRDITDSPAVVPIKASRYRTAHPRCIRSWTS